jgi:hypothetical protein
MSLNNSIVTQSIGVPYQQYITSSEGHTLVSSSTYFNDTSDNIPRYKDANGVIYDAIISSSYSTTASYALTSLSSSYSPSIPPFPFTGDAVITGSLSVSGSDHTITGSLSIHSIDTPGLRITSNNDSFEEVKIYDGKITIEDSGQDLATLSSNNTANRLGVLELSNWTTATNGVYLNGYHSGNYANWIGGALIVGRAYTPSSFQHHVALDVTGSAVITGSLTVTSGSLLNTGTVSIDHTDSPYTITGTQQFILIDPSGGDVIVNMPDASTYPGRQIFFKLTQAEGANSVTLQRQGSDTIDGATSYEDLDIQYESISTVSDGGTGWFIF